MCGVRSTAHMVCALDAEQHPDSTPVVKHHRCCRPDGQHKSCASLGKLAASAAATATDLTAQSAVCQGRMPVEVCISRQLLRCSCSSCRSLLSTAASQSRICWGVPVGVGSEGAAAVTAAEDISCQGGAGLACNNITQLQHLHTILVFACLNQVLVTRQ